MSSWVKFRDAFEHFATTAFHQTVTFLSPLITQVGNDLKTAAPALIEIAVVAATGAQDKGTEGMYQASKEAVLAKAKDLAIADVPGLAVSLRAIALNGVAQAQAPAV